MRLAPSLDVSTNGRGDGRAFAAVPGNGDGTGGGTVAAHVGQTSENTSLPRVYTNRASCKVSAGFLGS